MSSPNSPSRPAAPIRDRREVREVGDRHAHLPPERGGAGAGPRGCAQPSWAALIAAVYLGLALAYGFANPPFEATDEVRHFRYVRYLVLNRALPPTSVEASKELQAHHPPLYYALAALLTAPVHSEAGPDYAPAINPFWGFRYYEPSVDNKNQYLHAPEARWPFASGTSLIVYLARWLSTAFGLGTVLVTYRLGRDLFPERPAAAFGTMMFVAFNPTFLHSVSSVNNDSAAAFFGSWAMAEAARVAQAGPSRASGLKLGLALGLGVMAKVSVASLALLALAAYALAFFSGPRGKRELWLVMRDLAVAVAVSGLLAGWWFVRNAVLTGDPLGLSDYQSAWAGEADRARLIREAISGLPYAWTTIWARFDYGQVVLPGWVYLVWGGSVLLALAGLIGQRSLLRSSGLMIVLLALGLSLAGWAVLMLTIPATAHARHILPAYPAIGLILIAGWLGVWPQRYTDTRVRGVGLLSLSAGLLLFALYALLGFLAPAFAYPRSLSALPSDVTPASASFEGAAEIVGYRLSTAEAQPGDEVAVSVYWKPLAQTAAPLQVFVHFVDGERIIVAQRDTYPGLGNAVTTRWQVGQIFADTYRVFISDTAYAPETLRVRVGLWSTAESRPLIVGDSDALELGTVALQPRPGQRSNPIAVNFENKIYLIGYALDKRVAAPGETVVLTTHWRAVGPESDYWAYVHVAAANGSIWALADSVILPPVTAWEPGTIQTEARPISLAPDTPPGQYTIEFGVTRVSDAGQDRLPVLADDGHQLGDHIELTKIRVEP